jgi:hypothetical protein
MFFKPEDFSRQWQDQTRQWQEQMEKVFVEKINEMIRNPALLTAVSKSIETSFDTKSKANETIAEFMKKMNIPTKHDTGRILQYLQQVEARILDLDEKIDILNARLDRQAQAAATAPVTEPARGANQPRPTATRVTAKPAVKKPAPKAVKPSNKARR